MKAKPLEERIIRISKISDIHGFAGKILLGAYNSQTGDTRN